MAQSHSPHDDASPPSSTSTTAGIRGVRFVGGLWGESAGAHLAALLGLGSASPRVCGVVDWYGPADLIALDEQVGAAVDAADHMWPASPT